MCSSRTHAMASGSRSLTRTRRRGLSCTFHYTRSNSCKMQSSLALRERVDTTTSYNPCHEGSASQRLAVCAEPNISFMNASELGGRPRKSCVARRPQMSSVMTRKGEKMCGGTHLERLHLLPTTSHLQDLVAVPSPARRIERSPPEHSRVHVRGKHERVHVSDVR
jgi:hypothetical protein